MSEQVQSQSTHPREEVVKWVISRAEAARESGAKLPAWMIDAFEDAMEREDESTKITTRGRYTDAKSIKRDEIFKFELVYFKVEDTVFTVIKDWLLVDGSTFQDMFSLPVVESMHDGIEITNPIVLEQTRAESFRAFLNLLYGSRGTRPQTYDEWVGVLDLAIRWNFGQIRKQSIAGLNLLLPSLGPAARIQLARRFSVGPWLRKGLIDLVTDVSAQRLTREELMDRKIFAVDTTTIANIFFICFKLSVDTPSPGISSASCQHKTPQPSSQPAFQPSQFAFQPNPFFGGTKINTSFDTPAVKTECTLCNTLKAQGMNLAKEAIIDRIFGEESQGCLYREEL